MSVSQVAHKPIGEEKGGFGAISGFGGKGPGPTPIDAVRATRAAPAIADVLAALAHDVAALKVSEPHYLAFLIPLFILDAISLGIGGDIVNRNECIRRGLDFSSKRILEVGALHAPFVRKSEADVIYVDHADTETLRAKYADDPAIDVSKIVQVDAVWGEQTMAECLMGRKVDYILASHVIEHTPDLITWLQELVSVLNEDGEIRLYVPDKRYTFDYLRRLTEFADVLDAHLRRARRPLTLYVIDHCLNTRKVDVAAAWRGEIDKDKLEPYHTYEEALNDATEVLATQRYRDVHCWVFTPRSFADLILEMIRHDLLEIECSAFGDTMYNTLEFAVFVRKARNKDLAIRSWMTMAQAAKENLLVAVA